MKTKVEISDQVLNFVRSLAPEPRRLLRQGLRDLPEELGDIKQLEGDLAGWCRLRIKSYRIIFRYEVEKSRRIARCVFAERRELVYELFTEVVRLLTDS